MNQHQNRQVENSTSPEDERNLQTSLQVSERTVRPWVRHVARTTIFFYVMQMVGAVVPAYAQIAPNTAAPAGQRPLMDAANNGVPIVLIAPPSAAGVSRNQFNQFNVDSKGVILNNSSNNSNTTLGGWIAGNQQLGATSARIILNEVVSTSPSQLRGTIEVAGQSAAIVVANPNGVSCDGCGFLNATRSTLTTGTPQFGPNGSLTGFNVGQGQITVGSQGLNAASVEQLDLLARGIVIEGEIWAKNLNVIAGANQVLYGTLQAAAQNGSGTAPGFAIDIKNLGGMYANQIYMVATEQGLGVNSTGRIAALQGNLTLSANGDLTLKDIYAKQSLQIANAGNTVLTGQTASDGTATISSTGQLTQQGTIDTQGQLTINSAGLLNSGDITQRSTDAAALTIAGSVSNSATIFSGGKLDINATDINDIGGKFLASGDLTLKAQSIGLTNTTVTSDGNATLLATAGNIATDNTSVYAAGNLMVTARDQISNVAGSWQSAKDVGIAAGDINNQHGQILANQSLIVTASGGVNNGLIDNQSGTLIGNAATMIQGGEFRNAKGTIATGGALSIDTQGAQLDNTEGQIVGTTAVTFAAGKLLNTKGTIASTQSSININTGTNELLNDQGKIQALGNATIQAGSTNNQTGVISGSNVDLTIAGLDNTAGQIVADGILNATTAVLINRGGLLQSTSDLIVDTQGHNLDNTASGNNGGIVTGGKLTLTTADLDNRSGYIASNQDQALNVAGTLDNRMDVTASSPTAGTIVSNGKITTAATALLNTGGLVNALDDIAVTTSGSLDNRGGVIASNKAVSLVAATLDNGATNGIAGTIDGKAVDLSVNTLNNQGGTIRSTSNMTLNAVAFDSTNGIVSSAGDLALNATAFDNHGGKVVGAKTVTVGTSSNDFGGNISSLENLALNVNGDYANSGTVSADKELTVTAANINNSGTLNAGEKLTANTGDLINSGEISASQTTLNVTGTLTNTSTGLIDGSTTLINANVANNTGRIFGDLLKMQVDTLNNSGTGVIAARQNLLLGARNINNTDGGLLYSLGDISMASSFDSNLNGVGEVNQLLNGSARIEAAGNVNLAVKNLINRNDGLVTRTETTSSPVNKVYLQPQGSTEKYDLAILGWNSGYAGFGAYVIPSTTYPFSRYGSESIAQAIQTTCNGDAGCTTTMPYTVGDGIWDKMGVARPQTSDLSPLVLQLDSDSAGMYGPSIYNQWLVYQDRLGTQIGALDDAISAFNTSLDSRSFQGWFQYEISSENTTRTVVDSTRPAQILAGGAISVSSSGSVLNDNSNIVAGGAISITGANVENRGTEGTTSVTEVGFQRQRYVYTSGRIMHWYDIGPTTGAPIVTTETLQAFVYQPNASNPTASRDLTANASAPNASLAANGTAVSNQNVSTGAKAVNTSLSASAQAQLNGQTINRQWTLPTSSLFTINSTPSAHYLVETDPRFTSKQNFLSSDYYLNLLAKDPSQQLKRYGDGFVEQQMINDQILALTGRRYLSGYTSTETEYKGLMDAGIAFVQQYQISPGVSLSAEQMALLTTDIVILTTQSVTLPDGSTQNVLVPQVYLRRPQADDLLPSGGLIAGSDIYIKSQGDLVNSGQISANNETTLLAGADLVNQGGRITGQDIYARASNDLKNISGAIQGTGTNSKVALAAGRDIILETRTITGQTVASATTTATTRVNADRIATVQGGTVSIDAGRDLIGKGSAVQADTDITATAGRDIKISAVEGSYEIDKNLGGRAFQGRTGYIKEESVTNEVATFKAGRDVTLVAGATEKGDIALKGVNITAGNNVALQGANVTVEAVKDSQLVDVQQTGKNGYIRAMESDQTIVGGVINAGNGISVRATGAPGTTTDANGNPVAVAGTGDVMLNGATLNATNGQIAVVANNDVIAEAMTTEKSSASEYYRKSKSFLKKTFVIKNRFSDSTEAQVTSLNSMNDAVTVTAGNNVILEGTQIGAKKDVTLYAGNQLLAVAAHDTSSESKYDQKFTSGVFFSVSGFPVSVETRGVADGKTTTTSTAQGTNVTSAAGNVTLFGVGAVGLEGAGLKADQGNVGVAGGIVDIRAATDSSSSVSTHVEKGAKMNTIALHKPAEGMGSKATETIGLQETVLARTSIEGQNVAITATAGDAHIAGTTIDTPGALTLSATNGVIAFDGQQTEIVTSKESAVKDIMYQKVKGKGGTEQSTDYNLINAGSIVIDAPKITAQIGSKDSVAQLAAQPGMEWVSKLANDPALKDRVDWQQIEDASKHWDYKAQGLTPTGAIIVTIIVAFFTAGAASGAGTSVAVDSGLATTTTVGAVTTTTYSVGGAILAGATTAAISTLASQAAIALINNQGDLGGALKDIGSSENLKGLIAAIVTGGALTGLGITPVGQSAGQPTPQGGAQTFTTQLGQNLKAGVVKAVVNTAVYGGSLEDNLKSNLLTAFIDTAAAQGANAIGDLTKAGTLDSFANKIAHAIAGCAVGAAKADSGNGCGAGALGAVIGEIAAEGYGTRVDTTQFAAMLSGIAAAVAGLDASQINIASQTGANAAANNYLKHSDVAQLAGKLAACGIDQTCRNQAMDDAYRASAGNDVALLNCHATNNCDALKAEYRQGYQRIVDLVDSGFNSQEAARVLDMESNAQFIIRNNLNACKTATCQEKANYLAGVGKGLVKITPVGLVSGTGLATYQLTTAILENGLSDTASAIVSGIADLPASLKAAFASADPAVRGEALADALSIGAVATAVGIKLGAATWQLLSKNSSETLVNVNAGFKTLGLAISVESVTSGRQMVATLQKAGMPTDDAIRIATDMFKTSTTIPETVAVNTGDQLIKLVPTGSKVGPTSPFWLTQSELTTLAKEPSKLAERLGLPPSSQAPSYDMYVIQAKESTSVFESTVAKTLDSASGKTQTGGANQTIVLDRTKFTDPIKVGSLSIGK